MIKKIILDTNAYSALVSGDQKVLEVVERANQVMMSPICIGELLAGFVKGSKESTNRSLLSDFLKKPTVQITSISGETAEWYANIYSDLKKNGTPIPINDVWIAAQAMETGTMLITYDHHFQLVPGLRIWKFQ